MTQTKTWTQRREDLIQAYYALQLENGELNSRHMDTIEMAYAKGLDDGSAYLKKVVEDLIEQLKWIQKKSAHMRSDHAGEINQVATKALSKFEEDQK